MKRLTFIFAVATIAIFTLVGCCACRSGNTKNVKLEGTSWQLAQIGSQSFTPADGEYTILFGEDNKVAGLAKCNRIFGDYKTSEQKELKFGHMGMTRMMCPQPDSEDLFAQAFAKVSHYSIDGKNLILLNNGDTVAIFKMVESQEK